MENRVDRTARLKEYCEVREVLWSHFFQGDTVSLEAKNEERRMQRKRPRLTCSPSILMRESLAPIPSTISKHSSISLVN